MHYLILYSNDTYNISVNPLMKRRVTTGYNVEFPSRYPPPSSREHKACTEGS